mgnify:CR=1 FL=1
MVEQINIPEEKNKSEWQPGPVYTDDTIWRYRDFELFERSIEGGYLWFNRADNFEDDFEGSLPRENIRTREERYSGQFNRDDMDDVLSGMFKNFQKISFVNCWMRNNTESAAMWKLFTDMNTGVAIKSNPEDVFNSLNFHDGNYEFGAVNYIDYSEGGDTIPEHSPFAPLFHKHNGFEYEDEIRAVWQDWDYVYEPEGEDGWVDLEIEPDNEGKEISVDFDNLIDEVVISPFARDNQLEMVEELLSDHNIDAPIRNSSLAQDSKF